MRFKYIPKQRIDGTHNPTKIACSEFPLKNNTSEYMRESMAATKRSLSVNENFLIMLFFLMIFKDSIFFLVNIFFSLLIKLTLFSCARKYRPTIPQKRMKPIEFWDITIENCLTTV